MLFSHAPAAALTLASAVTPSLTNPFALLVALSGLGMAVAMLVAAASFRRHERGQVAPKAKVSVADLNAEVRPRPQRATSSQATREAKAVV